MGGALWLPCRETFAVLRCKVPASFFPHSSHSPPEADPPHAHLRLSNPVRSGINEGVGPDARFAEIVSRSLIAW
jgi:hypothetical protein